MIRRFVQYPAFTAGCLLASVSHAQLYPYQVDEQTLHLWHLDESTVEAADAVPGGTSMKGLLNGATLGNPSFANFGTSLYTNTGTGSPNGTNWNGGILFAHPTLEDGPGDNVPAPFPYFGAEGAFTFEAIIRLEVAPGSAQANNNFQIMSMEDDVLTATRVFQFRINDTATPSLEFLHFNTMGNQTLGIPLPLTGDNALSVGDWFHVAVTYNGAEATPDNMAFYWTKMGESVVQASLLGSTQMTRDLNGALGDFAIGNEGRASGGQESENFPGFIDEVRISGVARGADEFVFSNIPEPSSALAAAVAGCGLLLRRRRARSF